MSSNQNSNEDSQEDGKNSNSETKPENSEEVHNSPATSVSQFAGRMLSGLFGSKPNTTDSQDNENKPEIIDSNNSDSGGQPQVSDQETKEISEEKSDSPLETPVNAILGNLLPSSEKDSSQANDNLSDDFEDDKESNDNSTPKETDSKTSESDFHKDDGETKNDGEERNIKDEENDSKVDTISQDNQVSDELPKNEPAPLMNATASILNALVQGDETKEESTRNIQEELNENQSSEPKTEDEKPAEPPSEENNNELQEQVETKEENKPQDQEEDKPQDQEENDGKVEQSEQKWVPELAEKEHEETNRLLDASKGILSTLLDGDNQTETKERQPIQVITNDDKSEPEKKLHQSGLIIEVVNAEDYYKPEKEDEEPNLNEENEQQNTNEDNELPPLRQYDQPKRMTQSLLRNSGGTSNRVPPIIKPQLRNSSTDIIYRKSRGISIDNYDPNDRRPFTDPLTIQAMKNLGIDSSELFYPTTRDLCAYTRDRDMFGVVKNTLTERVKRTAEDVRTERDRLMKIPPTPKFDSNGNSNDGVQPRDAKINDLSSRMHQYNELEQYRMSKIKEKNRRDAEQIILSILVEREHISESIEQQEKDKKRKEEHEAHVKQVKREEYERQIKRIKELERQEIEKRKEDEKKRQLVKEQEMRYEARKAEIEANRKKYYEALEVERQRKNDDAKKAAEEFEEKRKKEYNEQQMKLAEREKAFQQRRKQEEEERKEHARQFEEEKQRRVQEVRDNYTRNLEKKRAATELKGKQQEESLRKIITARNEQLETMRIEGEKQQQQAKEKREFQYNEHERLKKDKWETAERKSLDYLNETRNKDDAERREKAIIDQVKREERMMVSNRIYKRKETALLEVQRQYEIRLKMIEQKEAVKRKLAENSQQMRNKLERQKYEIESGLTSTVELRRKNPTQLRKLADKLGVDFDTLQEKAKLARRGKRLSQTEQDTTNDFPQESKDPLAQTA